MKCIRPFALLIIGGSLLSGQSIISTLVGTDWIFPGDGKPALDAPLGRVVSVVVDREGRAVFPDQNNNMVMRLERDGSIRVIAGNGLATYSGDGELATNASLWQPSGLAYDASGNLFIADTFNHRIRRVSTTGIITTVAGSGDCAFSGDNGRATDARLCLPYTLVVDGSGTLFINDFGNRRIRRLSTNGIITTIAGNGGNVALTEGASATSVGLEAVESIALDSTNNLYIAEVGTDAVRRITPAGTIGIFGRMPQPSGLAFDREGVLWVSTLATNRIGRLRNGAFEPVAGGGAPGLQGGSAATALFRAPSGLAFDTAGALIVADRENFRIRRVPLSGEVTILAGNGRFQSYSDGTPAQSAFLSNPFGISVDSGAVLVADNANNRVRRVASQQVSTVAGNGVRERGPDNVQATQSPNIGPVGVVADREGNVYFSDPNDSLSGAGHVVRRVARNGVITNFAGTGRAALGGENQPAASTALAIPYQLAFDAQGSLLIADAASNRIRIVTNGTVRTFAGLPTGERGGPTENVAATSSRLNFPLGVAVDRTGNVYVGDTGNAIVRRITAQGVISTVAGGGSRTLQPGQSAQAREVLLKQPAQLAVDDNGVVYFVDRTQHVVFRLADGLLTIVAGTGRAGFAGDGAFATQALLNTPNGVAVDARGNVLISDTSNNRIRMVQPVAPTFTTGTNSLTFSAKGDGEAPLPQSVSLTGSLVGMRFSAATRVDRAAGWLTLTNSDGVMPSELEVRINPAQLAAGSYTGTIVLTSPGANPPTRSIDVRLTVSQAQLPVLSVEDTRVDFNARAGDGPVSNSFTVRNRGGGTLTYSVSATTRDGGSWLQAVSDVTSISANTLNPVNVVVNPSGLAPDTYTGAVTITAANGDTKQVPVFLSVSDRLRPRIVATQPAMRFTAAVDGGTPLAQTFGIANTGQANLNYRVDLEYLSGSGWLTLENVEGTSRAGDFNPPKVNVKVNSAGLEPGNYAALLRVMDRQGLAPNAPQNVAVYLTVQPAGQELGPEIAPAGLVFFGTPNSRPGSQQVSISNLGANALEFTSARNLKAGENWLTAAPVSGSIAGSDSTKLVVQPDFTGLAEGIYRASVNLRFSDGSVRTLEIVSVVTSGDGSKTEREQDACPVTLVLDSPNPRPAEYVPGQVTIRVKAKPNCNRTLSSGKVVVTASNGDRIGDLTHAGDFVFTGGWTPSTSVGSVNLTVKAVLNLQNVVAFDEKVIAVAFAAPKPKSIDPPVIPIRTAIVDSATYQEIPLVAPGSLVTIFGKDLSASTESASDPVNLPKQLGTTRVELAGKSLPLLYVSDSQVNAVVPYGVTPDELQSLVVVRESTPSLPDGLKVAKALPGIFIPDTTKPMLGSIYRASDLSLITPSNPAMRGEEILLYCAGLGAVDQTVEAGTLPPAAPAAKVISVPMIVIDGADLTPISAILSVEAAGRYEVRVRVPQNAPTGDEVPVRLRTGGQVSPAVNLSVR